jgi:aspartate kinase
MTYSTPLTPSQKNQIVVSKFGGTSMGSAEAMKRSARIVEERRPKIVVVSATSGTTNQLLEILGYAQVGAKEKTQHCVEELISRHQKLCLALDLSPEIISTLIQEISQLTQGIQLLQECSERAKDRFLSLGERLSSVIFTDLLKKRGQWKEKVSCFDVREVMITDSLYSRATPQIGAIEDCCRRSFKNLREEDHLYVTQGFIGRDVFGHTTTLGRGGSDYSASLLAEGVSADLVEIWTDVDGMLSIDPKLSKQAQPIRVISFREAAEMAIFGAKVLHPTTLAPAMRKSIPVYVGSSFEPHMPGTWIHAQVEPKEAPLFRAVAVKKDQCLVTLSTPKMLNAWGFLAKIFTVFEHHKVSIDAITTSEISVALTVDRPVAGNEKLLAELKQLAEVSVEENLAMISLIGNQLHQRSGVMSQVFKILGDEPIRMICQGASPHHLCLVVEEKRSAQVADKLHQLCLSH